MYYVIQVRIGKEQKVVDLIKENVTNSDIYDVFSPARKERRKYKGEWKDVVVKCFPGYLFVNTDNIKQLFLELPKVPEFTKILGRNGLSHNFVPLNENESRLIDILYSSETGRITEISDIEVQEGNKIIILDGPLYGEEAIIQKVNLHKRTVTVKLTLFNMPFSATVGINIINKLD